MNACAISNDSSIMSSTGLRILIVDDNEDILLSINDLLELDNDSYVIKTASDFNSAVALVESFQPDIALLDIKLGSANGIELVPVLKRANADTVCIMMTAFREAQYAIEALRNGADDFLHKPIEPELLFKTINHYQLAQNTLREKNLADKRFHVIFEQSYDHLFVLSQTGEIIDANETALSFYGAKKVDIVGNYFPTASWWIQSPRNLSMISSSLNAALKGEVTNYELNLRNEHGEESIFEFTFTPIIDDNGNTIMVISEGRNVTIRIKTQQNIIDINQMLEQRVKQRTRDLELARDEAEQANQAKTDFLSQMSHELRTPMNAILGFTQIMNTNPDEPLQPMQEECLQQVITAGDHLMGLINQVLNLSRIESGNFKVYLEPVSVSEIINNVLALTHPLIKERQLSVNNRIEENDKTLVTADEQAFSQVMINLLSNAIKFNRDRGNIIINSFPTTDGYLRISVHDTGVGIAKDKYEAVFARFERIKNTQSVDGTGIGLNISKFMVEMMGGRIGFDSIKDEGSCFWVELKIVEEQIED